MGREVVTTQVSLSHGLVSNSWFVPVVPGRLLTMYSSLIMFCYTLQSPLSPFSFFYSTSNSARANVSTALCLHFVTSICPYLSQQTTSLPNDLYSNAMSNHMPQQIDNIDPRLLTLDNNLGLESAAGQNRTLTGSAPADHGGSVDQAAAHSGAEAR